MSTSIQDYKLTQDTFGQFDLSVTNSQFDYVSGMETTIDVQVFTDRRTTKEDVATPYNRQGWMGDLLTKQNGYEIGSLVWLKNQSRNTQNDYNEVASFVQDSMSYFIGIKALKKAESSVSGNNININLVIPNGQILQYTKLWQSTKTKYEGY